MASESDPLIHKRISPEEVLSFVSNKILRYVTEVGHFERMVAQYGTQKDTTEFRKQIAAKREELVHMYRGIANDIKESKPAAQGALKVKLDKMNDQFERMHKEFQHFQESSIQNDRVYHPIFVEPPRNQQIDNTAHYTFTPGKNYTQNYQNRQQYNLQQQQQPNLQHQQYYQLQEQENVNIHNNNFNNNNVVSNIVEERNKDMLLVAQDMEGLKDVFLDLNKLAEEQGITLNQVHTNAQQADVRVEAGVRELVKAKEYSSSYRKKLIVLSIIIIIILVVLGLVLYFKLR